MGVFGKCGRPSTPVVLAGVIVLLVGIRGAATAQVAVGSPTANATGGKTAIAGDRSGAAESAEVIVPPIRRVHPAKVAKEAKRERKPAPRATKPGSTPPGKPAKLTVKGQATAASRR